MPLQYLTQEEKTFIRYGLALASEEICNKINNVKNKANNLKVLTEYKKQLTTINALDDKIVKM